ncbi:diadenosine tetraphosphate hydrolase [Candidatus Berkelbacteria bacterium CG10_big_fil_rev_8_21_14_0_10_43_13]|uniref:Diadenosine tetraphosphate hydrolase n=1 Tax=Candidatus Berkelbacteria bacterium CG10_big_fil_rev_8_21_14_0_10_43_13 TaxID=1974514 RepID=A0A2H0W6M4_9BACT|nr:MAG: diadenosine tetraphosphate hydrolase [Candidatus Berkelbacteria bacterium CG10_big_fil_rev_8_21_14_0_10_43_13]
MIKHSLKTDGDQCIFCEIAAGKISADLVFWSDDNFMAFLSIDPNTKGFSCVIPKKHYDSDVLKMPDEVLAQFIIATKKAADILENYFDDVGRVGILAEGTGINHAHFKLFPMHGTEYFKRGEWRQTLSDKKFWFDKYEGWISSGSGPMADFSQLKELASNIRKSLNG